MRDRKHSYRGTCDTCGNPTTGCRGPGRAPSRCITCLTWTPEAIVSAFREWAAGHDGNTPRTSDARSNASLPSQTAVRRCFDSWNAAVVAAGLTPHADRRPERTDAMVAAIRAGEPTDAVAARYGLTTAWLRRRLSRAGMPVNTIREATVHA